jgi:hypothetical protein
MVADEMVNFAIAALPDGGRERVERRWQTADSMTLVALHFPVLERTKVAGEQKAIAENFHAS